MKINFLLPHIKVAGGTRIILSYAHRLALKGHQVKVVVPERSSLLLWYHRLIEPKPKWFSKLGAQVMFVSDWDKAQLPEADITVADSWPAARFLSEYRGRAGVRFQMIQHDERLYHGPREQVEEIYRKPLKKLVVSTWLKEIMAKDFGQSAELFLNPTDFDLFHLVPNKRQEGEVRVLMLNHTYAWKGVEEGITAYKKVKGKHKEMKLIMFGARGKKPEECDEYYFDRPQNELASIYSSCHLYLCPSWDEGSGLPSMEAMASGCALVTYDNGGSRDYAFDHKTALVAKRRDVEDLTAKLEELVSNRELMREVAREGFNFVHAMPSWKEQTDRLEKVFQDAINI